MNKREIIKKIVLGLIKELGIGEHRFLINVFLNGCSDEKINKLFNIVIEDINKNDE